jgi:NADH-quinone oxidoreductase subunit L
MYHAIVFLPLIGALIAGFGGRAIGAKARNTSRRCS